MPTRDPDSYNGCMKTESLSKVDDDELLHLAIEASREQRHGDAINYLKQAVERSDSNYKAVYLLAAQHAQIGLNDRAIEGFRKAIEMEPNLSPARFQLGLLLLVNGRVEEALAEWQPLERLDESDPYLHFSRGMGQLCRDDFAGCEESLKRGIELNRTNPSLNRDMQGVLERMAAQLAGVQPEAAGKQPGEILLSAYKKTLN
jgi:tetratricopeptide (TPR) repeat protein